MTSRRARLRLTEDIINRLDKLKPEEEEEIGLGIIPIS